MFAWWAELVCPSLNFGQTREFLLKNRLVNNTKKEGRTSYSTVVLEILYFLCFGVPMDNERAAG